MNYFDVVLLSLKNLWRRKVRTLLTIIGVVIGTASIVVMLSLGIGMDQSFQKQVSSMGSLNTINVDPYYMPENAKEGGMVQPKQTKIDDKTIAAIADMDGVEAVTPILQTGLKIVSGKYVCWGNMIGMDLEAIKAMGFKTSQGRLLEKDDTYGLLFGFYVPQQFYNPKAMFGGYSQGNGQPSVDVMKDKVQLTFDMSYGEKKVPGMTPAGTESNKPPKLYKATVVGVLAESQDEKSYSVYMDINQLKALLIDNGKHQKGGMTYNAQDGYQRAMVQVKDIDKVSDVQKKIKDMGYGAYSLADIRNSMQKTSQTIQTVLGGIGAVSLIVAALGITNTMIMSIYERTREIGIMKVIGCLLSDIRKIFLLEAGLIGFLGGLVGIGLSFTASYILNHLKANSSQLGGMLGLPTGQGNISVIPIWLSSSSIVFATLIGLAAGLYPAIRAMRLSSLEAMRAE